MTKIIGSCKHIRSCFYIFLFLKIVHQWNFVPTVWSRTLFLSGAGSKWATSVEARATVRLTRITGTGASTVVYRSAWQWAWKVTVSTTWEHFMLIKSYSIISLVNGPTRFLNASFLIKKIADMSSDLFVKFILNLLKFIVTVWNRLVILFLSIGIEWASPLLQTK